MTNLLASALNRELDALELDSNEFAGREGVQFAIDCVENSESLEAFNWSNNAVVRMDAYDMLRRLLVSDGFSSLDLRSNSIRTGGCAEIWDHLSRNPALKQLNLAHNNLNDNDAKLIAGALKHNTNLRTLGVGQNDITDVGCNAMHKAIFDCTSLNDISDSNHTCTVEGLGFGSDGMNRTASLKCNRWSKLYTLLSSRNREWTNVRHLNLEFGDDSSSKLVPRVLKFVHEKYRPWSVRLVEKPEKPLSIMYEILRWKMPSLYVNARTAASNVA